MKWKNLSPNIMLTNPTVQRSVDNTQKIEIARARYPSLWQNIIKEWQTSTGGDAVWLTYSANYLFHTAGILWALDPFSLYTRLGEMPQLNFAEDLKSLQLVVLSHSHNDHFDRNLIAAIRNLPVLWVVPSFMLEKVMNATELPQESFLVPEIGIPIQIGALTLIPFKGQHFRGENGVPEMGYIAEFSGKRWLFPGDTRAYDINRVPHPEKLDGVFAHLWLGKAAALQEKPPLLDEFCKFFMSFRPKQIIVSHLEELGRDADDFWTLQHYLKALEKFQEISPEIKVSSMLMGQRLDL
jgi:hypothetical protein